MSNFLYSYIIIPATIIQKNVVVLHMHTDIISYTA